MSDKEIIVMSYTQITALNAQGKDIQSFDFRNAYRGAMHVWRATAQRLEIQGFSSMNEQAVRVAWDAWKDASRPDSERVTMLSTFDNVLVRQIELPLVAAAFRAFAATYGPGSLLEQAEALDLIYGIPDVFAVGWRQTSVIENPWTPWDAEADDARPFDFSRDEHWFLFDALKEHDVALV